MAIINSFLYWLNTRTGSSICGYYTVIISVVCLALYMLRYKTLEQMDDSVELKGIVCAGSVLYACLIGVSMILIAGVYMDRKYMLLPWIYVLVITVLYETGAIALITTVHLEQNHTLHVWEVVAVVFYCVRLIANCYSFACVVSHYQELSQGRGTFEFFFKPRQRHMTRSISLSELEEYNPPYGATLPPYSKENLYKEYSPPNYENLLQEHGETDSLASCRTYEDSVTSSRLTSDISSCDLADVIANLSCSDTDAYSERDNDCGNEKMTYSFSSVESSEEFKEYTSSQEHLEQHGLQTAANNQQCSYHKKLDRGNNCVGDGAVSMTYSSACLLKWSSDSSFQSHSISVRSKQDPTSPIDIQKRTYITWI